MVIVIELTIILPLIIYSESNHIELICKYETASLSILKGKSI